MAEDEPLPTLREALENWLGVKLPIVTLPQTVKNLDKAIAKIVLAGGENLDAKIRGSTAKIKARSKLDVEGMFRTEDEKRKLENRAAATIAAIQDIEVNPAESDATAEIDDDWLNLFARLAEDKSSEELQKLFGRILAGEVRRPGSFTLRTIHLMATVSKSDAENISFFLSYAISGVIVPFRASEDLQPTLDTRLLMEELTIAGHPVRLGGMGRKWRVGPNSDLVCEAAQRSILIQNRSVKELDFSIAGQILSQSAQELIPIAYLAPTEFEFLKEIATNIHASIKGNHKSEMDAGLIAVHVVTTTPAGPDMVNYNIVFTVPN